MALERSKVKVSKFVRSMLKENFQSFILVGFNLEGEAVRYCDYETDVQSHAVSNAIRVEVNENCQALEVYVRNLEGSGI